MKRIIQQLLSKWGYQISKKVDSQPFLNQSQLSNLHELRRRGASIGENVDILDNCIIDPDHCFHIKIGNNVTFAPNVHVLAHDASTKKFIGYTKVKNTIIGSNVFVGAGSLILPGVKVGDNVIIAAGSVVTKDIPDRSLAVGSPARVISSTEDYINKQILSMSDTNKFDESFTLRGGVDEKKRQEMLLFFKNNSFGYVE
jgi:maltose O-acetyltransferase